MARVGKKGPAGTPGPIDTRVPVSETALHGGRVPTEDRRGLESRERIGSPRTTTDDPWRDLHPTRVWPD